MDLQITPSAEKFIGRMIRFNGGETHGFRLSVSPGGCSGLSSEFTVEAEPKDGDSVVMAGGVKLFLPAESRLLLEGVTIDFVDTPTKTGLAFIDPKAAACACSSSASSGAPSVASIDIGSIARN